MIIEASVLVYCAVQITEISTRLTEYVPTENVLTENVLTYIVITATGPNDEYDRTWELTFDRDMPPLGVGGAHAGSDVAESHSSGGTMRIERILPSGAHYLIFAITQTGGSIYGVY